MYANICASQECQRNVCTYIYVDPQVFAFIYRSIYLQSCPVTTTWNPPKELKIVAAENAVPQGCNLWPFLFLFHYLVATKPTV